MIDPDQPAFPETHIYAFNNEDGKAVAVPRWNGGFTKREAMSLELMKSLVVAIQSDPEQVRHWKANGLALYATQLADGLIEVLQFQSKTQEGINHGTES